jgi:cobalt-zinc-cadmium resistance protein CzcA
LAGQKQHEYLLTQLQSQLKQYASQYAYWKNNLTYYQNTALPNARSMVQNAQRGYQSGDLGYLEYAQALQTDLEMQRSFLEAIQNLNQTVLSIQFLIQP